jgi:hypothetical protein
LPLRENPEHWKGRLDRFCKQRSESFDLH